jgi:hypothetical protein
MNPTRPRRPRFILRSVIWLAATVPTAAQAIGPADQKLDDPPTPLSIRATGLLSRGQNAGTGTVVAARRVDQTGFVAILTAHHVAASSPTTLELGSLLGGAQPWMTFNVAPSFQSFKIVDAMKNPANLPVDVALMLGKVNNLTDGSQALANFNQLAGNLPAIVNPGQDGAGNPLRRATASEPVGFTQVGYGRQAEYRTDAEFLTDGTDIVRITDRYRATGSSGQRLFQNNLATAYTPPAVKTDAVSMQASYYHPLVEFKALGPPNAMGHGLGMAGDSGSPLFTREPAAKVEIEITRGGNPVKIPVSYVDSLSAVFVASQSLVVTEVEPMSGMRRRVEYSPETVLKNSTQYAVPIIPELHAWMQPYLANPRLIPEPRSLGLTLVASLVLLVARSRNGRTRNRSAWQRRIPARPHAPRPAALLPLLR